MTRIELQRARLTFGLAVALAVSSIAANQVHALDEDPLVSEFVIDEEDPESSVPSAEDANRKPLQMGYYLMNLSERADAATARGDHVAAARFWRALGKAVPDRSLSFVRACKAYEAAGDLASAREQCRMALGKGGVTVDDHVRFVQLVLRKPGELTAEEIADIDSIAAHLREQLPKEQGEVAQNLLLCQLGTRVSDAARLRKCTATLQELAPEDPQTVVYQWSLAMLERDYERAHSVLEGATKVKLTSAAMAKMRESLSVAREQQRQTAQVRSSSWVYSAVPLLAVVAIALLTIYKLSYRRLQG